VKTAWTPPAVADLDHLVRQIAKDDIEAAFRTEDRVIAAVARLERHPASGRPGAWRDTRELVVGHTPYLVIYRLREETLEILRVIHGAQKWPPT
jgi:toxin ParE1/3/4